MKEYLADIDQFSIALEQLVADVAQGVGTASEKAVMQSVRKGAKTVKQKARGIGRHPWSEEYIGGFSSHVERGSVTTGEIGNKSKPGLVHLLEKGHQTINHGRKTAEFPHMAPAFEEIQEDYIERMEQYVDIALG